MRFSTVDQTATPAEIREQLLRFFEPMLPGILCKTVWVGSLTLPSLGRPSRFSLGLGHLRVVSPSNSPVCATVLGP